MSTFCLPEQDNHWKYVKNWVESEPLPGYQHAPPEAIEAFKDIKYAIRIHWGLYSLAHLQGESWPFLKMSKRQKQAYQGLYRRFNPTQFSAERWMTWFERVGLKCFAITTKHHEGFSLWDTQTRVVRRVNYTARGGPRIEPCDLAYSVMETPFGRDILTELCDAAHRHNLKIDFYFSHPDRYDADFRPYVFHPLQTPRVRQFPGQYGGEHYLDRLDQNQTSVVDECSPQETRHMLARHRAQLVELLTRFGKIDLLCLDMWLGADIWPEMRATLLQLRALQPEVMLRARGIGNYGDYYTPEGFVRRQRRQLHGRGRPRRNRLVPSKRCPGSGRGGGLAACQRRGHLCHPQSGHLVRRGAHPLHTQQRRANCLRDYKGLAGKAPQVELHLTGSSARGFAGGVKHTPHLAHRGRGDCH
jgi:alpha-L-fucosidase